MPRQLHMLTEPMTPADRAQAKSEREAWDALEARLKECEATLRVTNKIIADGALTGFNPTDGDWAERLFANQQAITKALRGANR